MTKAEEIQYVFEKKDFLISKKIGAVKRGDNVIGSFRMDTPKETAIKEVSNISEDPSVLRAKLVINTTGLIDSHMDCHIPGLWKKTLSETKLLYLLQEHDMDFDKIIADSKKDELKAYTETVKWKSLGYDYSGSTEALVFDTLIRKEVNPFMFDLYKRDRVYNHSVGMRYVKIYLCIKSDEPMYASENDNWNKYIQYVVNTDLANEKGYFWAVTDARIIEGSAVVKGSNECTPVMELEIEKEIEAAPSTSHNEPSNDTQSAQDAQKQFFTQLLNQ